MLKCISVQISLVVLLAGAISGHAQAIEKMQGAELQAVCKAFNSKAESSEVNNDKSLCTMYIKGFLAGEKLYRAETLPSASFRQKALASRAGGLLEKYQLTDNISYCIAKSVTIDDIAALINQQSPTPDISAEGLIEKVLQQNFQCDR